MGHDGCPNVPPYSQAPQRNCRLRPDHGGWPRVLDQLQRDGGAAVGVLPMNHDFPVGSEQGGHVSR